MGLEERDELGEIVFTHILKKLTSLSYQVNFLWSFDCFPVEKAAIGHSY